MVAIRKRQNRSTQRLQNSGAPAEIARRYPDRFGDVETVHRIKERILIRLRRAEELKKLVER